MSHELHRRQGPKTARFYIVTVSTLPHRVVEDIIEGLKKLDELAPGVASPQTLIYAPEIKYYSARPTVDKNLMTTVPGLFVAGDGAGLSRGINVAAATGVLAARGILRYLNHS